MNCRVSVHAAGSGHRRGGRPMAGTVRFLRCRDDRLYLVVSLRHVRRPGPVLLWQQQAARQPSLQQHAWH